MSQGKIVPLIAHASAKERVRIDAELTELAAFVRELAKRLDALANELNRHIAQLRQERGGRES